MTLRLAEVRGADATLRDLQVRRLQAQDAVADLSAVQRQNDGTLAEIRKTRSEVEGQQRQMQEREEEMAERERLVRQRHEQIEEEETRVHQARAASSAATAKDKQVFAEASEQIQKRMQQLADEAAEVEAVSKALDVRDQELAATFARIEAKERALAQAHSNHSLGSLGVVYPAAPPAAASSHAHHTSPSVYLTGVSHSPSQSHSLTQASQPHSSNSWRVSADNTHHSAHRALRMQEEPAVHHPRGASATTPVVRESSRPLSLSAIGGAAPSGAGAGYPSVYTPYGRRGGDGDGEGYWVGAHDAVYAASPAPNYDEHSAGAASHVLLAGEETHLTPQHHAAHAAQSRGAWDIHPEAKRHLAARALESRAVFAPRHSHASDGRDARDDRDGRANSPHARRDGTADSPHRAHASPMHYKELREESQREKARRESGEEHRRISRGAHASHSALELCDDREPREARGARESSPRQVVDRHIRQELAAVEDRAAEVHKLHLQVLSPAPECEALFAPCSYPCPSLCVCVIYMCMYIYIHIYVYIYIYICVCVCVCVLCVCVCVCVCIYMYMYVCMYVYIQIFMYICLLASAL